MLVEYDLEGKRRDKVEDAIRRLRTFEPDDGYFQTYSGGKDSIVLNKLCEMAGVKRDIHYSVTTVDPPELVRFIISQFEYVVYNRADGTRQRWQVRRGGEAIENMLQSIRFARWRKPRRKAGVLSFLRFRSIP